MSASNQVYRNSTKPSPNVYISDLVQSDGSGGTTINKLTVTTSTTLNGTATINAATTTTGTLAIEGTTIIAAPLSVEDTTTISGATHFTGAVDATHTITLMGAPPQLNIVTPPVTSTVGDAAYLTLNSLTGNVEIANTYTGQSSGMTVNYATTEQSVPSNSLVGVAFDTVVLSDPALSYTPGGVFNVLRDGLYTISYTLVWQPGAPGGTRWGWLDVASTDPFRWASSNHTPDEPQVSTLTATVTLSLLAGDAFQVNAYQDNTGLLPVNIQGVDVNGIDVSAITIQRINL